MPALVDEKDPWAVVAVGEPAQDDPWAVVSIGEETPQDDPWGVVSVGEQASITDSLKSGLKKVNQYGLGFAKTVGDVNKRIVGAAEGLGTIVSGAGAFIPSIAAGAGKIAKQVMEQGPENIPNYLGPSETYNEKPIDFKPAIKQQQAVQEALTLPPQTETGQAVAAAASLPFEKYHEIIRKFAPEGEEAKYQFIGDLALLGLPAVVKGIKSGIGYIPEIKDTNFYRRMTIKERGLVALSPEESAARLSALYDELKAKGMTDAELAKSADAFKQEALRRRSTSEQPAQPFTVEDQIKAKQPEVYAQLKKEVLDAEGIRKDVGEVSEGGIAKEAGPAEGSTNLEQQAPGQPGGEAQEVKYSPAQKEIGGLFDRTISQPQINSLDRIKFGVVDSKDVETVKKSTSIDITGYERSIDNYGIRHALNEHGDIKIEESRGQAAITKEDFLNIPDITKNPDNIESAGKSSTGLDVIKYSKRYNGIVYHVEEIRKGKRHLAFLTMYKTKAEVAPDAPSLRKSPAQTPEAFSPAPNYKISPTEKKVKPISTDRRQDIETRKMVAEMSTEEMQSALLTDELTGLKNKRAYTESVKKPVQVKSDVDGLKWINDNYGEEAGNALLKAKADALKAEGIDAYRTGGDEYYSQFDSPEQADAAMKNIAKRLEGDIIEYRNSDGAILKYSGGRFSYGTGRDAASADEALRASKEIRERAGERAGRGIKPVGLVEVAEGQRMGEAGGEAVSNIPAREVTEKRKPIELNKSQRQTLETVKTEIEQGEPARRQVARDELTGKVTTVFVEGGTYPDYFKGKGYTKKDALNAINKALNNQPLTENQKIIVEDLNRGFRRHATDVLISEHERKIAPLKTAWDLKEGGKFKIEGEGFKVTDVNQEGLLPEITVKDGKTYTIKGDERIQYDKGSFKSAKGYEGVSAVEGEKTTAETSEGGKEVGGGKDSEVTLDMLGWQNVYEATIKLLKKVDPKKPSNIGIVKKKGDLGLMKSLIASPNFIGGKARYYVIHAKNTIHKQDRLRGLGDEKLNEIFKPLKSKELRQEFEAISWMGDLEEKTFTADELDDIGVNPAVKEAYLKHRKFHDQVWRFLAAHRKMYGGETGYREGHIPHLFENWNVYEMKVEADESGKTREVPAGIVGTFRSLREASNFANGLDPSKKYLVKPKTFKMPDELIAKTVMKDASYYKLVDKMEKAFSLTREEAFEMVNEVARKKNKRRFFGNLVKRTGQTGFKKDDLYGILKHYYNSSARYVALDDFKAKVVPKFEKDFGVELGRASQALRDKNIAQYVEDYFNDVNGVPGMTENLMDASIKWALGDMVRSERPAIWAVNKALHFTATVKLGLLNLSAGMVNLTQLINTFSKVPVKHFIWASERVVRTNVPGISRGMRQLPYVGEFFALDQKDRAILRRIGIEYDLGLGDTGGYSMTHKGGKLIKGTMYFFTKAEYINRAITGLAAYRYARKDLHYSEKQAKIYARELVDKTQFDYSVADTARIFRSPAGRLLGQFKPFAIKQIEFITGLKGAEHIKFWVPLLLMAGTAGIPLIEGLNDFIEWLTGKDILLETKAYLMRWAGNDKDKKKVAEVTMYGVLSQLGIDVSKRVGTADVLPKKATDLLGPTINTLMQAKKIMEKGDKTELVKNIAPSVGNLITAIETVMNGMEVRDPWRRQHLKYVAKPSEVAIKGLGLRPIKEAKMADIEQIRQYETNKYTKLQQKYVDDAIGALMNGNAEGFASAITKAAEAGVIIDDGVISNEILQRVLPQDIRMLLKTRMIQKPDYLELMDFGSEDRAGE